MSRGRAPPFKQRLKAALDAAKAAGATKITVHPDGCVEVDLKSAGADELNDFDAIPPKPTPPRKHLKQ